MHPMHPMHCAHLRMNQGVLSCTIASVVVVAAVTYYTQTEIHIDTVHVSLSLCLLLTRAVVEPTSRFLALNQSSPGIFHSQGSAVCNCSAGVMH